MKLDIDGKPMLKSVQEVVDAYQLNNWAKLAGCHNKSVNSISLLADAFIVEKASADALQSKIDNAAQSMSETQPSWEWRCHAIMQSLGFDFGGATPDLPEESSWYARNLRLAEAERDAAIAEKEVAERERDNLTVKRSAEELGRLFAEAERDALAAEITRLQQHITAANRVLASEGRTTHDVARDHLMACIYGGSRGMLS